MKSTITKSNTCSTISLKVAKESPVDLREHLDERESSWAIIDLERILFSFFPHKLKQPQCPETSHDKSYSNIVSILKRKKKPLVLFFDLLLMCKVMIENRRHRHLDNLIGFSYARSLFKEMERKDSSL